MLPFVFQKKKAEIGRSVVCMNASGWIAKDLLGVVFGVDYFR